MGLGLGFSPVTGTHGAFCSRSWWICASTCSAVTGFTVRHGKIIEMNVLADPGRLRQLDLTFLDD